MSLITKWALSKRALVILAAVIALAFGLITLTRFNIELLPSIEFPVMTVTTAYPAASPEQVASDVTVPIESAVSGTPGLKTISSTSDEGFSSVVLQFAFGSKMDDIERKVQSAVQGVRLPANAQKPQTFRFNFSSFPVVQYSFAGKTADPTQLEQIARDQVVPALRQLPGVFSVDVTGGNQNQVLVALDAQKLAQSGVTAQQVSQVLQANNLSSPSGNLTLNNQTIPIRTSSQFQNLEQISGIVVGAKANPAGGPPTPVALRDVAAITLAPGANTSLSRTDGSPSIALSVQKEPSANTVAVADEVNAKLKDIQKQLGPDYSFTVISDQSPYVKESINGLVKEGLLGAVFAVLVIFVFLLSIRSTLVTAVSIPLSVLIGFILLYSQGITLNIMTLGGMAIAVGRVVDDSIVVLESIYRHVQRGESVRAAAFNGTKEVATAITASTITTVCVFLPLGFIGGIVGQFFLPFALTVSFALAASLLVALTIVPVLASFFIRRDKLPKHREFWLARFYVPSLRWALRHRAITLGIAGVLFFGSLSLSLFIPQTFLPASSDKTASGSITLAPGTDLQTTSNVSAKVEKLLADNPAVENYQTTIGSTGSSGGFGGGGAGRANGAGLFIRYKSDANVKQQLAALRNTVKPIAEQDKAFISFAEQSVAGSQNDVNIQVKGSNYADVSKVANELTDKVATVDGVANVRNDVVNAKPEWNIKVDPDKAALYGLSAFEVAQWARANIAGTTATQVTLEGRATDVFVRLRTEDTNSLDKIQNLQITGRTGVPAKLSDLATIEQGNGPARISRIGQARAASVTGTITKDATGPVNQAIRQQVNEVSKPAGVTVSLAGAAQQTAEGFADLFTALGIAIVLVYVVLVLISGSLLQPFTIMFSVPLASIGALLALFLTQRALGISSMIGLLMLVGIVVTNAIVLLDLVNHLRKEGKSVTEALVEGGRTRLRPILMTALATILASFPVALGFSQGSLIASELSTVVIGGLLTSTLLTLIVVPVVYSLFESLRSRFQRRRPDDDQPADTIVPDSQGELVGAGAD